MKKIIICAFVFVMAALMLISCELGKKAYDITTLKTIGDAAAANTTEAWQSTAYEDTYVYVFGIDGTFYRVTADMPEETYDAIMELDYMDEDYDEKYDALVYPLEINKYENLTEMMPTQSELDKLVGKTGADLIADGWYCMGYFLEDMEFYMNKDPFAYIVTFDGQLEDSEDFDEYEAIVPLKIKNVEFFGLGDATMID